MVYPQTHKRFPWTKDTVRLLIDSYAQKIEEFLSKRSGKTQKEAWNFVVENMKRELPEQYEESRELITANRMSSKFNSLKKTFKTYFFDVKKSELEKIVCFPYYDKMNKLFMDYASKHLNDSINASDETFSMDQHETSVNVTEADMTSYVVQLLDNDDDQNKTSITILPDDDDEHLTENFVPSKENVRMKLSDMQCEAVVIHNQKIRIDPCTPFTRVSNSTIFNHRSLLQQNLQAPSIKRKLMSELEPHAKVKDKKNPSKNACSSKQLSNNIDIIEDEYFEVEALDQCDLSDITVRHSKAIYHDKSTEIPSSTAAIADHDYQSNMNDQVEQDKKKSPNIIIQSVLEIPPCYSLTEDSNESIEEIRNADYNEQNCEATKWIPDKKILPKKLNVQARRSSLDSNSGSAIQSSNDETPIWFQNFLTTYESNIKNINEKLDSILASNIDKSLSSSSHALIHPKLSRMKFERL